MNILRIQPDLSLFEKGLYTVAEASALTGVPGATFRRWVFGYARKRAIGKVKYTPIANPEIGRIDGTYAVGFRDLLEARIVQAFREAGVSWKVIRLAAKNVRAADSHPFLSKHFRTDGRTIFQESIKEASEPDLLDLVRNQHAFHSVVAPSLYRQIEFNSSDVAVRWYPLWPKKIVVLDPNRSFGKPLVGGVPAETLAAVARVEGSADAAARWFDISTDLVRAAVDWQGRLAA